MSIELNPNKIQQKLINLLRLFGIGVKESEIHSFGDNDENYYLCFYPDCHTNIVSVLSLQYYVAQNENSSGLSFENWFSKFNRLSFRIESDITVQLNAHLDSLCNSAKLDSEAIEFLRGYTNDELLVILNDYPEEAKSFMIKYFWKAFVELSGKRLDECIECGDYSEPLREYAWNNVDKRTWEVYLMELSYGQSKDWAELVAWGKPDKSMDERYTYAYRNLKDRFCAMANLRLNIHRRFSEECDLFADKYFDILSDSYSSTPFLLTQSYMKLYHDCIKSGRSHLYADKFAKGMVSEYKTGDESYWSEVASINN